MNKYCEEKVKRTLKRELNVPEIVKGEASGNICRRVDCEVVLTRYALSPLAMLCFVVLPLRVAPGAALKLCTSLLHNRYVLNCAAALEGYSGFSNFCRCVRLAVAPCRNSSKVAYT